MRIRPGISFAAALLALLGWIGIMLICDSRAFGQIEHIAFGAILIFLSAAAIIEFVRMMNNHYEIGEDGLRVIHKKNSTFYPRQQIIIVCQKWACYKLLYIVIKTQSGDMQMLKVTYSKRRIKALSYLGYSIAKEF